MRNKIPKKLQKKFLNVELLAFSILCFLVFWIISNFIYSKFKIIFYVFGLVVYIYLLLPSQTNEKSKKYEQYFYFLSFKVRKKKRKFIIEKYVQVQELENAINKKRKTNKKGEKQIKKEKNEKKNNN